MTFFVFIFVILIIHFYFFLQLFLTGSTQISFFGWISEFNYSIEIANDCLLYILLCTITLCVGYIYKRNGKRTKPLGSEWPSHIILIEKIKTLYRISCVMQIVIVLYVIVKGRGQYNSMAHIRESINFLFELRIFPILLFTYLLQFIKEEGYRKFRFDVFLFSILVLLFLFVQARSLIFEIGCILGYYYLKRQKNKIKLKYILILYGISIMPNIIVLLRLSSDQYNILEIETWKNILTYEYTIIFNSILGETVSEVTNPIYGTSIINSICLIIPSFIREALGIIPDKNLLVSIAHNAGVFGGGFSLFAEMYLNFGWGAIIMFYFIGYFLGKADNIWFNKKYLSLKACTVPIIYSYILLGLRNDLGVMIKQIIQIYIVVIIIRILIHIIKPHYEVAVR